MILVDTHVVLWLALYPEKLSKRAKAAIDESRQRGHGLAISGITLLEIANAESKGRIKLSASLETFLSEIEAHFVVLPINGRICVHAFSLPATYPKDPADRIIAATGIVEGVPLVTADHAIRRSRALPTIW